MFNFWNSKKLILRRKASLEANSRFIIFHSVQTFAPWSIYLWCVEYGALFMRDFITAWHLLKGLEEGRGRKKRGRAGRREWVNKSFHKGYKNRAFIIDALDPDWFILQTFKSWFMKDFLLCTITVHKEKLE